MKVTGETVCALALLASVGCAGVPPGPDWDSASVLKSCSRELRGIYDFGTVANDVATAVFTVFTLGTNVGGYEFCQYEMTLHPAPVSSVQGGVYQSYAKSFTVSVPERLKQDPQNPSGIWQSVSGYPYPDMAIFPVTDPAGMVYFASGASKLADQAAALSPREFESHFFTKNGTQFLDRRGVSLRRLYEEDLKLHGDPAVFVVYEEDSESNFTAKSPVTENSDAPVFLLYWVIKTSTHAARLAVVWPESCPKCSSGPEDEIRKMSPSITTFVDSFRFTDAH